MTTKILKNISEKIKSISKKKLVILITVSITIVGICVYGIAKSNSSSKEEVIVDKELEKQEVELPEDYYEPTILPYDAFTELIPHEIGQPFDIKNYVEIKAYGEEYTVWFEEVDKKPYPSSYRDLGLHPVILHIKDSYGHEATYKTNILSETKEVIDALYADEHKPTISKYTSYKKEQKKKLEEEKKTAAKKTQVVKEEVKTIEYGPGYDPNSRAVQVAQSIVDRCSYGSCDQVADQFIFDYYGRVMISDECFYEVSESDAIPGDYIIYQSGKAHVAIFLGGGMALHGGIGANKEIMIAGVNAFSNVRDPKYYRFDVDKGLEMKRAAEEERQRYAEEKQRAREEAERKRQEKEEQEQVPEETPEPPVEEPEVVPDPIPEVNPEPVVEPEQESIPENVPESNDMSINDIGSGLEDTNED